MFVHRNLLLFASHLAEPVVLQLLVPGVQVEHLLPELNLLPGRVALLHTAQDVAEARPGANKYFCLLPNIFVAVPLLLAVLLAPGLGAVSGQLLQSLDQLAEVLWLKLLKISNKQSTT